MFTTNNPFPVFLDLNGRGLNGGKVYFGIANQNPITNPQTVYWDDGVTVAAQPLGTLDGYIVRAGTPATVFVAGKYSILVVDRLGTQVYYAPVVNDGLIDFVNEIEGPAGSSLVGFIQSGTGAVPRTVQAELRATVTPEQFGGVGDGVVDDAPAIQRAANSIAATGGTVFLRAKYRAGSNITLPPGVTLRGDYQCPRGRPSVGSGAAPNYSAMGSSVRLSSTATITLGGSCSISGIILYRYGMVFPATPSSTAAAFAGTAITIAGDDTTIENCLIMGFNKAYYLNTADRPRINRNQWDNINNIEITNSADRAYISENHAWPFATICAGQAWQNLIRSGKNVWLHDFLDWAGLTNNFSYGYRRGFVFENINSTVASQCAADNAFDAAAGGALHVDSINIEVIGACYDTKLIGCQTAAGYDAGVNINLTAGRVVQIIGHSSWGGVGPGAGHGILVTSGDALITQSSVRDSNNGIAIGNATSKISISNCAFDTISGLPIQAGFVSDQVQIGVCDYGSFVGNPVSSNIVAATIVAASPLVISRFNTEFIVTGNTTFGSITSAGWKGRRIMLQFTGTPTVITGTGASTSIRLNGSVNFVATAGSCLYLYHNGVQWFEEGRIA